MCVHLLACAIEAAWFLALSCGGGVCGLGVAREGRFLRTGPLLMEAEFRAGCSAADLPREMRANIHGHVVLTQLGPIDESLVRLLKLGSTGHCVNVPDAAAADQQLEDLIPPARKHWYRYPWCLR